MQRSEERSSNSDAFLNSHLNIKHVGACVRPNHFKDYSKKIPNFINWFELLADNFFHDDNITENLPFIFERPSVLHCVGLSIGSAEPLNKDYLNKIKKLDEQVNAIHISDHLCWTRLENQSSFDLLPLPYCQESVELVSDKLKELEDFFSKPFLLENVSTYLPTPLDTMSEVDFINEILSRTDSFLLLDVNNIYVNSVNHKFDPHHFIDQIEPKSVKQIHMAGHKKFDTYILDNHGDFVDAKVWELYKYSIEKLGHIPTCLEWDQNIPDFETYLDESRKIHELYM